MNALKNILFFGLLLAVLCGVYLTLTRSPEPALPPALLAETKEPTISFGKEQAPPSPGAVSGNPIPDFPSQAPTVSIPPSTPGGIAPPFQAPQPAGHGTAPGASPDSLPAPPPGTEASLPAPPPGLSSPPPDPNYPPRAKDPFVSSRPPPSPAAPLSTTLGLDLIMQQVKLKVGENRFADALLILSQLYGSPDLPMSQAREVTLILDQLAAKVIYSREHWLESAYLVQDGDSLDAIADRYQVPALLLARINGIRDPRNLPPGKELKVLKGPFSAQISTDRSEMTVMLAGRYAGRFSVRMSDDLRRATSLLTVRDKRPPTTAVGSGTGKPWIELGNASGNVSVQGTNDTRVTTGSGNGSTIWLSEQDMDDVFGILSVGSRVIIQR